MFSLLPKHGQTIDDVILGLRWPSEFLKIYREQRFEQDDPVFHKARHTIFPFDWNERVSRNETSVRGRDIMQIAATFGLVRGFTVPIHGPNGFSACVRMGGKEPDLSCSTKLLLRIVAVHAFERLIQLKSGDAFQDKLTQREQEVLALVARGYSAREIAEQLSITKRTVDEHASRATAKLGATNRTHAVALATQGGLISVMPRLNQPLSQ